MVSFTVVEDTANRLYAVREPADPNLAHCWMGTPGRIVRGHWVPGRKPERLIRRAGTRVVFYEGRQEQPA
jgi:hypothetical protein